MRARGAIIALTLIVVTMFFAPFIGGVLPRIGLAHAVSGCYTPPGCSLNVNSSIPANEATVYVEEDNNTGLIFALPHLFQFPNNTIHTLTVLNTTLFGQTTGARYVWKQWTIFNQQYTTNMMLQTPNILYNYTGPGSWVVTFDKQFQYTLSFHDAAGNPLSPAPASVSLCQGSPCQGGGGLTINAYTNQWLSSRVYTITAATWEGTILTATTAQTLDLTQGSATATVSLTAYPATVQVVDNNNNPVSGANITVTFVNATTRSFLTNTKGLVQLGDIPQGTFGATVRYENQQYGPFSFNSPTNTVQVNAGGSSSSTTTTAIVLLAIFGIAFFLILLAIRVRKPAGPPRI